MDEHPICKNILVLMGSSSPNTLDEHNHHLDRHRMEFFEETINLGILISHLIIYQISFFIVALPWIRDLFF